MLIIEQRPLCTPITNPFGTDELREKLWLYYRTFSTCTRVA
jgi:hypothetical protein